MAPDLAGYRTINHLLKPDVRCADVRCAMCECAMI